MEYLELVHEAYEEWLVSQNHGKIHVPILILDADKSKEEMVETYEKYSEIVRGRRRLDENQILTDFEQEKELPAKVNGGGDHAASSSELPCC